MRTIPHSWRIIGLTHISRVILDVEGTFVENNDAYATARITAMAENGYKVRPLLVE
jgi:hypothetical protein